MTSISKNVYIDKLDDIVRKYNNTYHTSIKMKPDYVKDNTHIDFKKEFNDKDPKFKIGDHVRISKYKNIFAKGYMPNWSEEIFIIKKIKNTVPWTYGINDLNGEEIISTFYENELQKTDQKEFRIEKILNVKFESNNIFPTDEDVNIPTATIVIRDIFAEDGKYYPQLFLDDGLYKKCQRMKESIFQMESMLMSEINQKNVSSVIIGIF